MNSVSAQNKVVVVPMAGDDLQPLETIVTGYPPIFVDHSSSAGIDHFSDAARLGSTTGGFVQLSLTGPRQLDNITYGLKSVTYCIKAITGAGIITRASVHSYGPLPSDGATVAFDGTDRSAAGCHTLDVNSQSAIAYMFLLQTGNAGGFVDIRYVSATWVPASMLNAKTGGPSAAVIDSAASVNTN